jgi:hypothetical protein
MLSVIIPVVGKQTDQIVNLNVTLECLRRQSFRDFELILVEQFEEKPLWEATARAVKAIYIPITDTSCFCPSWCRNVGARAAKYSTLVMFDAGVVCGTDYLAKLIASFDPGAGYLVAFNKILWLTEGGRTSYLIGMTYHTEWSAEQVQEVESVVPTGSGAYNLVVFDSSFYFDTLGGYSENYCGQGREDEDILTRAMSLVGDLKLNACVYTLLHLGRLQKDLQGRSLEADIHYNQYTQQWPLRVSELLVAAEVGKSTSRTLIDLPKVSTSGFDSREVRTEMFKNRSIKYSFEDFTNQKFLNVSDLSGSVIVGSCFYQESESDQDDPRVYIFPEGMRGVTFIECNLDNVYIPPGNVVDPSCSCKRIKRQCDGERWILNDLLDPIEPVHKERFLKLGEDIRPTQLPYRAIRKVDLRTRRAEQIQKLQEYYRAQRKLENGS